MRQADHDTSWWRLQRDAAGRRRLDPADLGTAYGLDESLAGLPVDEPGRPTKSAAEPRPWWSRWWRR